MITRGPVTIAIGTPDGRIALQAPSSAPNNCTEFSVTVHACSSGRYWLEEQETDDRATAARITNYLLHYDAPAKLERSSINALQLAPRWVYFCWDGVAITGASSGSSASATGSADTPPSFTWKKGKRDPQE